MRLVGLLVVLATACSSNPDVVELTVTFAPTVSSATIAQVQSLSIHASGDENDTYTVTPGRAFDRTERIRYMHGPTAKALAFTIDALDTSGADVASGTGGPISVTSAASLEVVLSATAEAPALDLGGPDLTYPAPAFVNGSLASAQDTAVTVTAPSSATAGMVLLAMVGGVGNGSVVSISAPSGWSELTSASLGGSTPATATWFWRTVTTSEPTSYTFTRGDSGPILAYVAAYAGAIAQGSGSPFDGTATASGDASVMPHAPSINIGAHDELVVLNGFVPDTFTASWSSIPSFVTREAAGVFSADMIAPSYGDPVGGQTLAPDAGGRWITLTTGIHGVYGP